MQIRVASLAERPDLIDRFWIPNLWPPFLTADAIGQQFYARVTTDYSEYALIAWDAADPLQPLARSCSVPFAMGADLGRTELPDDGWRGVIGWSLLDEAAGRTPTHVSALEVAIRPDMRGSGLASKLLEAKRANVARLGFDELVAPVRPSHKHQHPLMSMGEYVGRARPDGLPEDPWLRLHVRMGATIVGVCSRAMVIDGSLEQWRGWTGLPFDTSGDVTVPGALNPVHCDVTHGHAVYVEPGVWVRHLLN